MSTSKSSFLSLQISWIVFCLYVFPLLTLVRGFALIQDRIKHIHFFLLQALCLRTV